VLLTEIKKHKEGVSAQDMVLLKEGNNCVISADVKTSSIKLIRLSAHLNFFSLFFFTAHLG